MTQEVSRKLVNLQPFYVCSTFANTNGLPSFEALVKQDSHLWYWDLISSISYVSHFKTLFIINIPYTLHFNHLKIISTLKSCESIARGWNSILVQIRLSDPETAHLNSQQPYVWTKFWNTKVHTKIPASVTVTGLSIPFNISHQSLKNVLTRKRPREVNEAIFVLPWKGQSSVSNICLVALHLITQTVISDRNVYWVRSGAHPAFHVHSLASGESLHQECVCLSPQGVCLQCVPPVRRLEPYLSLEIKAFLYPPVTALPIELLCRR